MSDDIEYNSEIDEVSAVESAVSSTSTSVDSQGDDQSCHKDLTAGLLANNPAISLNMSSPTAGPGDLFSGESTSCPSSVNDYNRFTREGDSVKVILHSKVRNISIHDTDGSGKDTHPL